MKQNCLVLIAFAAITFIGCGESAENNNGSLLPTDSQIQAKKQQSNAITQSMPSIIVFPSDAMLKRLGNLKEVENQGAISYERQYQKAFIDDEALKFTVAVIEEEFAKVGFPLENLEQILKQIASNTAMDEMTDVAKDLRSELLNTARPDYIIEVDYDLVTDATSRNLNKSLMYSIKVLDVYSNKTVASISKTNVGKEQAENDTPSLIKNDLPSSLNDLKTQVTAHYANLLANGIEITLRVATTQVSGVALDDDCGEEEIGENIVAWLKENTVNQSYKMSKNTSTEMYFTNVRIFSQDEDGQKYTAYDFAKGLKKGLKKGCGLDVTNKTQSLGDALIVINGVR
jgi:hypothetical protein